MGNDVASVVAFPSDGKIYRDPDSQYIETVSGNKFSLDPEKGDKPWVYDIAYALSLNNRFTGHTSEPLNVAWHSLNVSSLAEYLASDAGEPVVVTRSAAFYGLLHDASEAYLSDIAAPFKDAIAGYRELENKVQSRIEEALSPGRAICGERARRYIKQADAACLFIEAELFLPNGEIQAWAGADKWLPLLGTEPYSDVYNDYEAMMGSGLEGGFWRECFLEGYQELYEMLDEVICNGN